ncbi:MAG: prepilin-type N-terminal cleavage/methylation domain-containing protein [bacterium]
MKKKGFTLIELLVVIAIIGILSSVVVVSLQSARTKARDAKRVADIGEIKTALGLYYDTNQSYPATIAAIGSEFLAAAPVAPTPGVAYSYAASPDGTSYHLGATLEQVAAGTGVLANDRDCNSLITGTGACFAAAATTGGFDGTAANVYDVTP